MNNNLKFKKLVSHLKQYGFVWQNSEIYGGIKNLYDWGPLGVEIKRNLKNLLWSWFISNESEKKIVGYDGAILSDKKIWQNSQHEKLFFEYFTDCKDCKFRFKVDDINIALNTNHSIDELNNLILKKQINCLNCNSKNLSFFKQFNMLFNVDLSLITKKKINTYLRPETAQNIFINIKNIVLTQRLKFPFGVGQIGKAFRNETTMGNFIFRTKEFEQFELEYFVFADDWKEAFDYYLLKTKSFFIDKLKINHFIYKQYFHEHDHLGKELAHYSKKTTDIVFDFGFGQKELLGIAYRSDFDLLCHFSKDNIIFTDSFANKKFIPHVVELSIGIERMILALFILFYFEDSKTNRIILKLPFDLAPYKIAVLPLTNKFKLESFEIYKQLKQKFQVIYDDSGSIGKRYYRQDAIGTPYCITYDYDSKTKKSVTVRERDTAKQKRVLIDDLIQFFSK